ncbi:MAG: right-handed parallel beta-helix repeat-containing protein, partial [Chromatiales bacterium]|nr:right-handed parallel beta-helix repeat-containing protein [Chromatiales bacterium]
LDGVTIAGNFIGTDGSNALSDDTDYGIDIRDGVTNATIGGPNDADRNLIAGNGAASAHRISVGGGTVQDVVIQGNLLSTNAAGTALVPANDAGNGITFSSTSSHSVLGNVIGGGTHGVVLSGTGDVMIQGNYIGTNATPVDIGGTSVGVWIVNGPSTSSSQNGVWSNEIANWSGGGIQVAVTNALFTSTGNEFMGNRIYGNTGLGIDLRSEGGSIGVTPNDAGDFDSGGNNLQNFPVINSAISPDGMNFVANYSMNGSPNTLYRIELFVSSSCDASGYGEGERFLGAAFANTDGSGNVTLNAPSFVVLPSALGQYVTMTATNTNTYDTSEFSACTPIMVNAVATPAPTGWPLLMLASMLGGLAWRVRRIA